MNLVLNYGPSNETLQTGPTGAVVSFFEGVGDTASFGATEWIRETLSPGSSCFVNKDSTAYFLGELTSYASGGAGAVKGLIKAGKSGYKAYKAGRAARAAAPKTPDLIRVEGLKLPGVPKGAAAAPVRTGKGLEYQIPKGTPELDPRVTSIRIMDPVTKGPHQYPNGYATYMNAQGQRVNPLSGRMIHDRSDPFGHIPLR